MKNIITVLISVSISIFVIGTLLYFDMLPHRSIALIEENSDVQSVELSDDVEEEVKPLDEAKNMIKNVVNKVDKESACRQANEIMAQIEDECGSMPFPGVDECIAMRIERAEVELKEENLARAEKMKSLNKEYVALSADCK